MESKITTQFALKYMHVRVESSNFGVPMPLIEMG